MINLFTKLVNYKNIGQTCFLANNPEFLAEWRHRCFLLNLPVFTFVSVGFTVYDSEAIFCYRMSAGRLRKYTV